MCSMYSTDTTILEVQIMQDFDRTRCHSRVLPRCYHGMYNRRLILHGRRQAHPMARILAIGQSDEVCMRGLERRKMCCFIDDCHYPLTSIECLQSESSESLLEIPRLHNGIIGTCWHGPDYSVGFTDYQWRPWSCGSLRRLECSLVHPKLFLASAAEVGSGGCVVMYM